MLLLICVICLCRLLNPPAVGMFTLLLDYCIHLYSFTTLVTYFSSPFVWLSKTCHIKMPKMLLKFSVHHTRANGQYSHYFGNAAGACWPLTDLCHVCVEQRAQAHYSPKVYIPSSSQATRPVELHWSIRVPPNWIYNCSCCRSVTICHRTAFVQPIRGGHCSRFYQSFWFSLTLYTPS